MNDLGRQRIRKALMGLLLPVAKFLLRAGIGYRDFSEIAKQAFVKSAADTFGVRGRQTNISRIALLTGLTRKEVRELKAITSLEAQSAMDYRSLPAEVLHRWHTAEKYLDPISREPLDLPYSGDQLSFEGLVKECMRDIPAGAVRTELKRLGAIEESHNGSWRAIKRAVVPLDAETKLVEGLETGLSPLARTIVFNAGPANVESPRFQRIVSIPFVKSGSLEVIEQELGRKLTDITEELDDLLARYEVREDYSEKEPGFGVGVYYFREGD